MTTTKYVWAAVLMTLMATVTACGPSKEQVTAEPAQVMLANIKAGVAEDMVAQYDMVVKRDGSALDKCTRAGLAAEAFLQAKNEKQYDFWKMLEQVECEKAGITK